MLVSSIGYLSSSNTEMNDNLKVRTSVNSGFGHDTLEQVGVPECSFKSFLKDALSYNSKAVSDSTFNVVA